MGLVELSVSDLDRSVAYWQHAVGLRVLSRENGTAELGADVPLVRLVDEPGAQSSRGFTGLFHVALLVPDRASLGCFFAHTVRDVDAFSSFRRKAAGRLRMLVFGAFIHRRMQDSHLGTEPTTPTACQQMEPKPESLQE